MAFVARKTRERRAPMPVGRGKPIVPNAAIEAWYRQQMNAMAKAMIADYRKELGSVMASPSVRKFYGKDESPSSAFTRTLNSLRQRWRSMFEGFAIKLAPEFTGKVDAAATSSTLNSLSVAGLDQPRATYNESIQNTLKAATEFNHTLITNISQEVHEKIYSAIMLSLTSPNPEEQGTAGITNALRDVGEFSEKRIKLIAKDQTSKLYSSVSDERMGQNGVEEFEWMHSSAGKVPRHTHVEKNGQIFKLNDPRLWQGPKADQGPPGWAINCRCRKIPVIR
jgi:SPP1 gp7 family putative phage head morphogenesis protein